ncbi:hypothetical protein KL921_002039 [Ogataea angusta]|uniref:Transcription factor domain-containing protein n=1 Tax=Pichia angusta TaxID=870730 RepID=A0ABQ7RZ36_PICAN|nr:hypothetical protein KL921_002039 [Ogataea angusta]KAG7830881.1 hypothetical protein KL920_001472 [Ogataea angusta]KAG7840476.1 hypothetical protein KL942_002427 [Ogataea angusta]KAG7848855.1 hypothetical protein KL941_001673 [Ogataea angusta]KAG7850384.1 hypothetical protein KL940_001944 [Ogataea angusta]
MSSTNVSPMGYNPAPYPLPVYVPPGHAQEIFLNRVGPPLLGVHEYIHASPSTTALPYTSESSGLNDDSQSPAGSFPVQSLGASVNNLAHSLNDLLESKIDEIGVPNDESEMKSMFRMFERTEYQGPESSTSLDSANSWEIPDFLTKRISIDSLQIPEEHRKYLELFDHDYARVIMPLQPLPHYNPAREILLTYANKNNYLMAAILSCGALQSFRKTQDAQDEKDYCSYLSTCLQLLSTVLADQNKISANVEPMLLTILLLTSYTAMSLVQKWRPHLCGAKDLLSTYAPFSEDPRLRQRNSYVVAFCRNWYLSIENIAGLTAPLGGVLKNDRELDLAMYDLPYTRAYWESMMCCRRDGFNYLYGYTNTLGVSLQKLIKSIKIVRSKKNSPSESPSLSAFTIFELTADFHREAQFEIISKTGIVPRTHFMHPDNNLAPPLGFEPLSPEAIEKVDYPDGTYDYISWYDVCHQSFVITAFLIITSDLGRIPKKHPIIQELVQRALHLLRFLDSEKMMRNYCILIVQVAVFHVGLNCVYDRDREFVTRYFTQMNKLHTASASITLKRLRRNWEHYDKMHDGDTGTLAFEPDLADDDDYEDVMNY